MWRLLCRGAVWASVFSTGLSHASPFIPRDDQQLVEVLPSAPGAEMRRLRKLAALRPADQRLALMLARRQLAQARDNGDPRPAGQALATLARWPDAAGTPADMLLLRAELRQYLHQFNEARATLDVLLSRPDGERNAQAWLMLATILRVQGNYAESDGACIEVRSAGADLYADACLAENAGLRGDANYARNVFHGLLRQAQASAAIQAWLWTSLAELEMRAGDAAAAERAFLRALATTHDSYAVVAYADFLINQQRPQQAIDVLTKEVRTDAVLLRLAIAGAQVHAASAADDAAEMRSRIALSNQRPGAQILHGREQAMFALSIDRSPQRALLLARGDVSLQREPIDLLIWARAANSANDHAAKAELRALLNTIGMRDRRIDALL
jgi:tetratricopeptide (TPR) repeat protein